MQQYGQSARVTPKEFYSGGGIGTSQIVGEIHEYNSERPPMSDQAEHAPSCPLNHGLGLDGRVPRCQTTTTADVREATTIAARTGFAPYPICFCTFGN